MRRNVVPVGIAMAALLVSGSVAMAQDASPTPPPVASGILKQVQDRGQLVCGINGALPGFSQLDEGTGTYSGFDVDFCKAIAAAVLGDASKVEYRTLSAAQRGPALQTGEVDVLIRNTTWTVTRDTSWGLFAPTTFFDGQGIMVRADLGVTEASGLASATICVQSGTTTELNVTDYFRANGLEFTPQVFAEIDPTYQAYEQGACDAVTSDASQLASRRSAMADPSAHVILTDVLSKEPLGPVVPLGDDQWYNVVKWVVFGIIQAEESGITSANVADLTTSSTDPQTLRLLGVESDLASYLALPSDWAVQAISAVGNYGEIFDRNLGPSTPLALERGLNALWTDGGLLYAMPYR
ncbi:MAG: amino acid ABC transporter substrate-binding protein [Chloroflexi bacterium]|nr:amino acid ABC transporter substrate-binding protein [Chloroflexota bacterium]